MTVAKQGSKEVTIREIMVAMIKVAREVTGYRVLKDEGMIRDKVAKWIKKELKLAVGGCWGHLHFLLNLHLMLLLLYGQLIFLLYLKDLLKLFSLAVDDVKASYRKSPCSCKLVTDVEELIN